MAYTRPQPQHHYMPCLSSKLSLRLIKAPACLWHVLSLHPPRSLTIRASSTAAFLAWNWFYAYCVLSSRTLKQRYGIDHNGNPRQDLIRFGDAAIREGKLTKSQLEQTQRMEAASANSVDGYQFFAISGKLRLEDR
ncbi:uncharacterized protein Z518_01360 [Rhinocladiella mackenziei CBS 650.93]|uniref:Rhinocladiella mackenziei CBS 650.93 unplaced genomic scaffold supercont1.1, whole genome shotgun sequence n=1 Tax=Rhinocladiella mackenziei CBS 650.93 TaxID=1442369 RepID=A0A0D2HHV8_9EURO|nr:uncharacterized protein Z518_01360 [Rhinocladiella mackenziei CBS 650.93]KIX10278.1 hypothetical protein Z518_01360 [Rhinocladiella mackenziei CBS 650.93]